MKRKLVYISVIFLFAFILFQILGFLYYHLEMNIINYRKDDTLQLKWIETDAKAHLLSTDTMLSFVKITPGSYFKGSEISLSDLNQLLGRNIEFLNKEFPAKKTIIHNEFWLADAETTVSLFKLFVEYTGYTTIAQKKGYAWDWDGKEFIRKPNINWLNYTDSIKMNQPVTMVSWVDAKAFTNWLSINLGRKVRLPTDDEWEYACKAGSNTVFNFGDDTAWVNQYAWFYENQAFLKSLFPARIKTKLPNHWGLYDMHGNVWEWCDDSPSKWNIKYRSIRGGSWLNKISSLRSSFNASEHFEIAEPHIGFRILVE